MEPTNQNIRVVIADSNVFFRQGLRSLLAAESDLKVIADVANAEEALYHVQAFKPDVLLLDLNPTDVKSAEPLAERTFPIRQAHPELAILFVTREDGPDQLQEALEAGARGYMLKNSEPLRFVAAIRAVTSGVRELSPDSLSRIVADLQALSRSSQRESNGTALTLRETEVVRLLAEGNTVREVAAGLSLSKKTVEAHKLNLMRKLNIHNRAALIEYAVRNHLVEQPVPR